MDGHDGRNPHREGRGAAATPARALTDEARAARQAALAAAVRLADAEQRAVGPSSFTLLYPLIARGEASLALGDAGGAREALERATALADAQQRGSTAP
jgi:hypothetical protein